jgi:hypothetical protein
MIAVGALRVPGMNVVVDSNGTGSITTLAASYEIYCFGIAAKLYGT